MNKYNPDIEKIKDALDNCNLMNSNYKLYNDIWQLIKKAESD